MPWTTDAVRVRLPATSANLGPGFDAVGLALSLYDEVEAWVCESGLSIEISGEGADLAGAGEDHLVVRAMRAAFAVTGGQPPGLGLRCVNRIPHGRGLGSSAAAIVGGILAARALAGAGPVARRVLGTAPRFVNLARPVLVNGEAGALFGTHDDPIAVVMATMNPALIVASPAATTSLVPKRRMSSIAIGEKPAVTNANGSVAMPAPSGS